MKQKTGNARASLFQDRTRQAVEIRSYLHCHGLLWTGLNSLSLHLSRWDYQSSRNYDYLRKHMDRRRETINNTFWRKTEGRKTNNNVVVKCHILETRIFTLEVRRIITEPPLEFWYPCAVAGVAKEVCQVKKRVKSVETVQGSSERWLSCDKMISRVCPE